MHIEKIDINKIKVTVDEQDQEAFGVSYETMSYSDKATRNLCETIIAKAKKQNGFSTENSKIFVEAKQNKNGNVTLYISRIPIKDDCEEYLCQTLVFENENDLLDGCRIFGKNEDIMKSVLYSYKNKYYLYFEIFAYLKDAKKLLRNLLEYSQRAEEKYQWLDEYANKISDNVIQKINSVGI